MPLKNTMLVLQFIIMLFAAMAGAQAQPQTGITKETPPAYVSITATPELTTVKPGMSLMVAIEEKIADGWHVYWRNPGDSGEPIRLDWKMPEGFQAGDIFWPVPERIPYGPLTNYGYENEVTLLQALHLPQELPEGPIEISADIDILVCKEICIPENHTIAFTLNDGSDSDNSDLVSDAFNRMPVAVDWDATYGNDANNNFVIDLLLKTPGLIAQDSKPIRFDLLPYEWGLIDNTASTAVKLDKTRPNGHHLLLAKPRGDRPLNKLGAQKMLVTYAAKDAPDHAMQAIEITARPAANGAAAIAAPAKKQGTAPAKLTKAAAETNGISLAKALFLAMLGGLILNLMPCVFPILSMKALSLSKMSEKTPAAARAHGIAYTAGILLCFGIIAALMIALKSAGAQIGWGFQLQNPLVVLLLAYLLFVIGLNLSGFFEIAGSFTNVGSKLSNKQGLTGSFFTGVLATLVATPCTAPFMGVAMGFALVQPAAVSLTVFLALGFGLALPYLALSFIPALRAALPKPGNWMVVFRELLAFPMYASAAWLIWVYSMQTGALGLLYAMVGFVGISFAIWIFRYAPDQGAGKLALRGLALLVLLTVLAISLGESVKSRREITQTPAASTQNAPEQNSESAQVQPYTAERYESLLAGNAPFFINMTAAWCITCKVNERVALDIPATKALFAAKKITYLKGDWTNQNPEITAYLNHHGRNGVPLYVFYGARDAATGKRPDPVVLPQLLTPGLIAETLGTPPA